MEKVHVAGHTLAVHRSGRGEPVLLVHGITTWSFLWREVAKRLAERHEVIAVDLLGCGDSAMPTGVSYSLDSHAEYLAELVGWLGVGPVHYVGHDLGGGIGQIMAVRHASRLRSLSVVNSVAYDYWPVQPIIALRTPVIRQLVLAAIDAGALRLVVQRGLYHKEKLTPALMDDFLRPLQTLAGRRAFAHFARCLDNANLMEIREELRKLTLPVTIAWGMADAYLSRAIPDRLAAEIPGATLHRLPTAGHFSPIDEPEPLAAILLEGFAGGPRNAG
jgi:pimeloyl-ACP methyl ester carboxylesterase